MFVPLLTVPEPPPGVRQVVPSVEKHGDCMDHANVEVAVEVAVYFPATMPLAPATESAAYGDVVPMPIFPVPAITNGFRLSVTSLK